jgi:uncharacterized protein YcbK (DUF882 family)
MMIPGGVRERSSGSAVPAGAADVAEERATSERKFGNRTRLLHEVVRIQRARRAAEPARVASGYRPTSASSTRASSGGAERGGA